MKFTKWVYRKFPNFAKAIEARARLDYTNVGIILPIGHRTGDLSLMKNPLRWSKTFLLHYWKLVFRSLLFLAAAITYVYNRIVAKTLFKDYAEELLGDATYGAIVKAMLNYGAYAQLYFAAKSGNQAGTLANASCAYTTELDSVTVDVADPTQTGTGKKVAKLILDTTTSIVIYDAEGNKIGEQTGISSKNLDTAYEIDCGTAGKVTVSVLAIGEKVLASQSVRDEYKSLIKALKLFSDASEALA